MPYLRFVVDVFVKDNDTQKPIMVASQKKLQEGLSKYAAHVLATGAGIKLNADMPATGNVHQHADGCRVCESEAPYTTAGNLTIR